jgi:hypothetical protein
MELVMKCRTILTMTSLLVMLLVITLPMAQSQEAAAGVAVSSQSPLSYVEGLYKEYAAGTAGKISFSVQTVENGRMPDLAGKPFGSLVSAPPYRIVTDQLGTALNNPRFVLPENPNYGLHDMSYTADKFADYGFPLEDGLYRRLRITATIGSDVRSHEAMEFYWPSLNHSALLDPVVVFLESKVNTRLRLTAEGWGPRLTLSGPTKGVTPSTCGLSSHHTWTGETLTWSPWTAWAKDIFGVTLWQENLAQQIDGTSCNTSCKPLPFTTSSASSSFANLGYTTACAHKGDAGVTGATSRSIAETDCTEEFIGQASASVSVNGSGASISFSWSLGGSANSNGGIYTDSCGYF